MSARRYLHELRNEDQVDPRDDAAMAEHNKCDDCCLVIGCPECGPSPEHPWAPDPERDSRGAR